LLKPDSWTSAVLVVWGWVRKRSNSTATLD